MKHSDEIKRGIAGREEGVARSYEGSPDDWKPQAHAALANAARANSEITSENVWDSVGPPPEPRAMGAVMRAGAASGFIEPTDRFTPSRRASRHRAPLRVWKSLLYK